MTTRRTILSALFAAPLAKLWPKAKSKIGPQQPTLFTVEHVERERPFPMPKEYLRRHTDVLTMVELAVLCMWRSETSVILADPQAYREIWSSLAPMDRWAVMESKLFNRGFMTFNLFGMEVAFDHGLKGGEIWCIDPTAPDRLALNNLLTYRTIDIHPRTPPTEHEAEEWGGDFEGYFEGYDED
jgi:hypothetical protein